MRSRPVAVALAVLLPLGLVAVGAAPAEAAGSSVVVKGHVRSPTGKPIAGIHVTVRSRGQFRGTISTVRGVTSATGRYEVRVPPLADGLSPAATYELKATDPGDADADTTDGEWAPATTTVKATSSTVRRIDQVLHHGAKLSGRAYDSAGRAVRAGLVVYAGTARTTTRAGGTYRFTNLPAAPVTVVVQSPTTNGNQRWFTRASTHGTLDSGEATVLKPAYGQRVTGLDIRFPTVAKLTGRIRIDGTEPFGEGADYTDVQLLDAAGMVLRTWPAKPAFFFRDLPAGTYFLRFSSSAGVEHPVVPEYYADAADLAAATPVVVKSGGAITGLTADLATAE